MADPYDYEANNLECEAALKELSLNQSAQQTTRKNQHQPLTYHILSKANCSQVIQSTSNVRIINSAIFIESTCNDSAPSSKKEPVVGGIQSRSATYVKVDTHPPSRPATTPSEHKSGTNGYINGLQPSPLGSLEFSENSSENGMGEGFGQLLLSRESLGNLAWQKWYDKKQKEKKLQKEKEKELDKHKRIKEQELLWEKEAKDRLERNNRETWLKRKKEEEEEKRKHLEKKEEETKQQSQRALESARRKQEIMFENWVKKKEKERKEQELAREEEKRAQEQEREHRKEKNRREFEEWQAKAVNRPKPVPPIIYDPKIPGRELVPQPNTFWNPNPWRSD